MSSIETYTKAATLLRQIAAANEMDRTMLKNTQRYIDQRINYLKTQKNKQNDSLQPN